MKCVICGKNIMPWHKYCTSCGFYANDEVFEDKKILAARREKLNASFVYSKANVHTISNLNKDLRKRMKKLYEGMEELRKLFLRFQEEDMKEFFEFKIDAHLIMNNVKTSPVMNKETADKIRSVVGWADTVPQFHINTNYNGGDPWGMMLGELLEDVEHRGVFANRAFDKLKICRMMDIVFNQQKVFSLADALYLRAADWNIEYDIVTSQHLWQPDEKFWNKRVFSFRCKSCGKLQLPLHKRCPACGCRKMAGVVERKIRKQHRLKLWRKSFDWNYENKTAVYALNDKITEMFDSAYDEMFKIQKIFKEELAAGKKYFNTFDIEGKLKYKNREPYPLANKKMAWLLNESFNENCVYHGFNRVDQDSVPSAGGKRYNAFIDEGDMVWNIECFDSSLVGNHPINYFMHSVFQDGHDYTLHDILYMNAEDFYPQYKISLSDRR